ncbi:hypothetical protein SLEP1_g22370 [Rubroshorea leprosula]|uniref:Secreted protein n=1 Tax=Rubroshorea leprosula TaxID=152421 RepID=A0AAV5JJV1_9ROSI|nr:hypothetical protein SLEP1_g22370 [Rubroshorea leprosula]
MNWIRISYFFSLLSFFLIRVFLLILLLPCSQTRLGHRQHLPFEKPVTSLVFAFLSCSRTRFKLGNPPLSAELPDLLCFALPPLSVGFYWVRISGRFSNCRWLLSPSSSAAGKILVLDPWGTLVYGLSLRFCAI